MHKSIGELYFYSLRVFFFCGYDTERIQTITKEREERFDEKCGLERIGLDVLVDIVAGMLIAVGVYNFALNANFPVAGFSESPLSCITCWGFR